ncbi:MAG: DHA2 family efflux MFS transporter permease subunit [Tatlockia sp.]|jgi:EmrB/QacA subfamily drug resistance transporter
MLKTKPSPRLISLIVALSFFMEAVDTTVINTAIPVMAKSLQVDPVDLKVALISYLLSLAIFIPISGWLSDKFGAKRVFLSALCIFTLSSLACGFANNLTQLILARFLQGLGGALGLPVGRLILVRTFGREHMISTMNTVVMVGAIGMMLGPVIGGVITHYFSWQWIFWVNIPVGLLAIVLAFFYLHSEKLEPVHPLDSLGFILFGVSLAGFTFGLSALSETSITHRTAISVLLGALLLLIAYSHHSKKQAHPIVKMDLLQLRTFRVSVMGNLFSRLGFGGMPFLIPLFLQIILGKSPQFSGLLLAPMALGIVLGKPCTLFFLRLLGYKKFLMINTITAGLVIVVFASINSSTSSYAIGFLTFLYGFILTLQYGAMNSLAYADLSAHDLSSATSIISTLQQIAQSFGVAVSASMIHLFSYLFTTELSARVFHYTFVAMGCLTLLSIVIFIPLKSEDGAQMITERT